MELVSSARQTAHERPCFGRRPLAKGGLDEGQRCRPAFGPAGELRKDVRFQRPAVRLTEQLLELRVGESEVAEAELSELPDRPELRDRDSGLAPAREDDREPLRSAGDDLAGDQTDIRSFIREVEVVEDEGRALGGD